MLRQPGTQIKLTNVSIVRMKKGGKRFEIACYKNKVNEFRSGIEHDLSEVLQIEQVFSNVPKGLVAKKEDWEKAFGTSDMTKVIAEILQKGELQVNNLERSHQLSSLNREIATLVSEMTIDPTTSRKHTVSIIEKAMSDLGFSVKQDKPAKAQALDLIKRLQTDGILPIRRVRMRVRVVLPGKGGAKDKIKEMVEEVEEEEQGQEWEAIVQIEPGAFRKLTDLVINETKGKGRVESMGGVEA
ncbi:SBDS family rRNA metabolism protein [Tremella mesenterica]|uniref:SBDS family rRNA metabolism protein n=1 Tax=Tremella mesenterica TaxID=5217 RepID=A0A4Q1BEW9_TREME|nr:SBDS family rRNA metabolism protein [Tremella mesenterica]